LRKQGDAFYLSIQPGEILMVQNSWHGRKTDDFVIPPAVEPGKQTLLRISDQMAHDIMKGNRANACLDAFPDTHPPDFTEPILQLEFPHQSNTDGLATFVSKNNCWCRKCVDFHGNPIREYVKIRK